MLLFSTFLAACADDIKLIGRNARMNADIMAEQERGPHGALQDPRGAVIPFAIARGRLPFTI